MTHITGYGVVVGLWARERPRRRSDARAIVGPPEAREARRWRFKPGIRDGVPVAMWKKIPVTFKLEDRGGARF